MHVHVELYAGLAPRVTPRVRACVARALLVSTPGGRREQKEDRELDLFGAISLCRASPSAWMR